MVVRLVYYSRAAEDTSLQDIRDILNAARINNSKKEVCGMLCFESGWFIQALEGDRGAVNRLFQTIANDPRHEDVVIISYELIESCAFPNRTMGYATDIHTPSASSQLPDNHLSQIDPGQALQHLQQLSLAA